MAKKALFIIDVQDELALDPLTRIPHAGRIRDAGDALLQRARKHNDQARSKGEDPSLQLIFVQHDEPDGTMMKGSKAWELVFIPRDGDDIERLVAKQTK